MTYSAFRKIQIILSLCEAVQWRNPVRFRTLDSENNTYYHTHSCVNYLITHLFIVIYLFTN